MMVLGSMLLAVTLILIYGLAAKVSRGEEKVNKLNATLEQRVEQRTTELSQALTEVTRNERMAALGSLVAGISHELNTPIGNSLTVASTLQEDCAAFNTAIIKGITKPQLTAFVERTNDGAMMLVQALHCAAELVSSFKQVAVDQTSDNFRQFNLSATVDEILLTLAPTLRKSPHVVRASIGPNIELESYPGPLGQVITNLVNNACVHAFDGIESGRVDIIAEIVGPNVLITVSDNGNGASEENLPRLFDPFFTTKLGHGGSGLGLSIVYNIVKDVLIGSIRVENKKFPDKGLTFYISLPTSVVKAP
jgi:C4-dicarboxylate-specific signal transduction histidine kinase